jgi:antitoxin VapB
LGSFERDFLLKISENVICINNIYQLRIIHMSTAKVFWTGRSQAVRLPKEFRLDTDEVRVRRHGEQVILEPMTDEWGWLERAGPLSADFMAGGREQPAPLERPELDKLFP